MYYISVKAAIQVAIFQWLLRVVEWPRTIGADEQGDPSREPSIVDRQPYAADRPHRLFGDYRAPGAETSRRRPHGDLGDRQRRGMGPQGHHAAHGADATCRRRADARYPQLVLARIRQSRRLLAFHQSVRRIQNSWRA